MNNLQINIKDIPAFNFEGYYWYSNAQKPNIHEHSPIDQSIFTDFPFVIEANFYAHEEQISISVKHIDGAYYIMKYDLSNISDLKKRAKHYEGHDLGGKNFLLYEDWSPVADPLLEDMAALQPSGIAFIGFQP